MLHTYAVIFCSSFVYVFLKAFQQLNVVHKAYKWIVPVSMFMAVCEVFAIATAAKEGMGWVVVFIGVGSGLGAISSMFVHSKFIEEKHD